MMISRPRYYLFFALGLRQIDSRFLSMPPASCAHLMMLTPNAVAAFIQDTMHIFGFDTFIILLRQDSRRIPAAR